jgi:hypothetical protein
MIRLLGVALAGVVAISPASSEHREMTKAQYVAAVESAIGGRDVDRLWHDVVDFEMPSPWPASREDWLRSEQSLRTEIDLVADRLERLTPPAEVSSIHAAWISSLRSCAGRFRKLEGESPVDALIVAKEARPCLERHAEICDRFYAKDYSFG